MRPTGQRLLRGYTLLVYAFLYAPIAVLIVYSFNSSVQTARWLGFTPRWYAQVLRDHELIESAWNSLLIALATTLFATVVGTLAALALVRLTSRIAGATR